MNAQEILSSSLFDPAPSDMTQALEFMQQHGVALSSHQIKGITLLRVLTGYDDVIQSIFELRQKRIPTKHLRKVIEQMAQAQAAAANPNMISALLHAEAVKK